MTNTSTDSNLPQKLADEFSRIIRDSLSLDEMAEILRRNRTSAAGVCATHDFRDANFYMAEAFTIITGREPESDSDADAALWSAAWAIAKNAEFPRKMELIQNVEGVSVYAFAIRDMWISLPRLCECPRSPADPITLYRLRPEEVLALEHANSFLIAERAKAAEGHTTRTEHEVSTANRGAVSEPRTPHYVKCADCHWRWIGIILPLSASGAAKVMSNLCCPYCASKRIAADQPADIPPVLPGRGYPEDHFNNIDAGFFSADTFHDPKQLARAEWYMARWQLETRDIRERQAQSEDSD